MHESAHVQMTPLHTQPNLKHTQLITVDCDNGAVVTDTVNANEASRHTMASRFTVGDLVEVAKQGAPNWKEGQ